MTEVSRGVISNTLTEITLGCDGCVNSSTIISNKTSDILFAQSKLKLKGVAKILPVTVKVEQEIDLVTDGSPNGHIVTTGYTNHFVHPDQINRSCAPSECNKIADIQKYFEALSIEA